MDSYIDLKNISAEELKHVDLDRVNVNCSPPGFEPQRQYYFMAKCKKWVWEFEKKNGSRPTFFIQTFGCQMNTVPEKESVRII